ncbi:hypothetical protein [Microcoleus sp. Pol12A5]|jgi:hypothetical protein
MWTLPPTVLFMELIVNANQQLGADSQGKLIVVNEVLGKYSEIKLEL